MRRPCAASRKTMKEQLKKILSRVRFAVDKYQMIEDGDRIAVGVSGGKDSLTLLWALAAMRSFYPHSYEVIAVQIDMGFHLSQKAGNPPEDSYPEIAALCEKLNVPYVLKKTEIAKVIFDIREESNPCALCAKMRRGSLHDAARENGCNKLALGHHFDDAAETMMLNLFFEGRIGCFSPVTYLSRKDITLIRPLVHTKEKSIRSFAKHAELPVKKSPCPADGNTQRAYMKEYLKEFETSHHKGLYERLVGALERGEVDGWKV